MGIRKLQLQHFGNIRAVSIARACNMGSFENKPASAPYLHTLDAPEAPDFPVNFHHIILQQKVLPSPQNKKSYPGTAQGWHHRHGYNEPLPHGFLAFSQQSADQKSQQSHTQQHHQNLRKSPDWLPEVDTCLTVVTHNLHAETYQTFAKMARVILTD
jgi:hypothetical protein